MDEKNISEQPFELQVDEAHEASEKGDATDENNA